MSSDVSYCVNCGKCIPKGEALCRECYEKEHNPSHVEQTKEVRGE